MSDHQHLASAIDRLLTGLRGPVETSLREWLEEIERAAAAERDRAVEEAREEGRRDAQRQVQEARDAAKRQHDDVRRAAESQMAELRALLDDIRRNAQQQIDAAHKTIETQVAATRSMADAEIDGARRIAQSHAAEVQRAADARVADLTRDLEDARRALDLLQQRGDARPATSRRPADELLARDLLVLDEASSLSDAFERLLQLTARRVSRAAIVILESDRYRLWRASPVGLFPDARQPFTAEEAGIAAGAARSARAATFPDGGRLPAFAEGGAAGAAAAFPLLVAGGVVAVLYADTSADHSPAPPWIAELDALARCAGRVLAAITVEQAAGVRPVQRVAQASQMPPDGHLSSGGAG